MVFAGRTADVELPDLAPDGRPMFFAGSPGELRAWLEEHHTQATGTWLVTAKKNSGRPRLEYGDLVEELLCFGWIDSTAGTLDERHSMLWVAPRKPKSGWSRPNKERVERLLADGRMHPAGLAAIDRAKENGAWSLLDAVEDLVIPDDLAAAFDRVPGSADAFEGFSRSVRRMLLEWIVQAKRPETRANRIQQTAEAAARGEAANQWKPKK